MVSIPLPQDTMTIPGNRQSSRRYRVRMIVRLLACSLIVFISGCGASGGSAGRFVIGETSGEYCGLPDNQLAIVVWIDEITRGYTSTVEARPGHHFRGEFSLKDGRKVTWNCSTSDGKKGSVEIAGVSYELEKGGLFLISTKGGDTKVEQLPIEAVGGGFRSARANLESVAKTDPKITSFLNTANEK